MSDINVTFPDGRQQKYATGTTPGQILGEIKGRLSREAIAAKVNGDLVDLSFNMINDTELLFITFESEEGRDIFWHSAAHVMAHAVKELYPDAKFAFGPPVDGGFYYDIDVESAFTPDDLIKIEEKMKQIVKSDQPFERQQVSVEQALEIFKGLNETYKVEQN